MRIASLLALLAAFILLAGCEELGDPQVPPAVEPQGQGSTEPVISEPEIERIEELVPHTDGTIDPNPTVPPITPSDVLDPTGSVEPTAPTEQVQAEAGVGEQGQSLTPGNMITEPARAFFSAKQSIIFANAEHALQLYKATNDSVPQSTEEYMEQVIKANSIQLPELRKGQRYVFDPESEKLLVERPQPQ